VASNTRFSPTSDETPQRQEPPHRALRRTARSGDRRAPASGRCRDLQALDHSVARFLQAHGGHVAAEECRAPALVEESLRRASGRFSLNSGATPRTTPGTRPVRGPTCRCGFSISELNRIAYREVCGAFATFSLAFRLVRFDARFAVA
jgi:hypothetical protein